jgi:hypothetical protein
MDAYAELRIRRVGMSASGRDACHLFMEAMNSLETGRRNWYPGHVDLVKFLIDSMWSISSNWARQRRSTGHVQVPETDLIRYSEQGEELDTALERAQPKGPSPEEQLVRNEFQTEEQLVQEIKKSFRR